MNPTPLKRDRAGRPAFLRRVRVPRTLGGETPPLRRDAQGAGNESLLRAGRFQIDSSSGAAPFGGPAVERRGRHFLTLARSLRPVVGPTPLAIGTAARVVRRTGRFSCLAGREQGESRPVGHGSRQKNVWSQWLTRR